MPNDPTGRACGPVAVCLASRKARGTVTLRHAIAILLAAVATPAAATWREATSTHFTVYSEGSEAATRDTAERLEKYLYVVRALSGALNRPDSPLKLRVVMQRDTRGVQSLMAYPSSGVAGFYDASIRGAVFVGPRASDGEGPFGLKPQQIMFHELTHHFVAQYFPAAYPTWYSEGLAEYYGLISFAPNNVVSIGAIQNGRLAGFAGNEWLPVGSLLTAHGYGDVSDVYLLYSEGWALVHYLSLTKARPGQPAKYLNAINAGKPFGEAATSAFGDLGKLNDELDAYAHRGTFKELVLPFKQLDAGAVAVRPLGAAEDAMLLYDIQLTTGVPHAMIGAFADRVEATARRFPDDLYALSLLADTQRLAGRTAGETAAVDHWLRIAPADGFALAARARLLTDALVAAKSTDEAQWGAVRRMLVQASKAAPDQPRILEAFYDSYARRGTLPPDAAQNALYRAYEILPQDDRLRQRLAADFEARGMIDEAIVVIKPAAYAISEKGATTPKEKAKCDEAREKYKMAGDTVGETAREMLARLEGKKAKKG